MYEFEADDLAALEAIARKKHARKNPSKPKLRADGEGSVFPVTRTLKNGTERTYYRASRAFKLADGKTTKRVVAQGSTPEEAVEKRDLALIKLKVAYGLEPQEMLPPDPKLAYLTVADCLLDWLKERKSETLSANTIHMYDARIRNHLLPAFGDQAVRLLTYPQLKEFFGVTLPNRGLGVDSIRQTFICLKSALDHYQRDGIITVHPMVGLKAPAKKAKTVDDTRAIRAASKFLGKELMPLAREAGQEARWFLGLMGMRQGEVLGMTDDSLDHSTSKTRGRRIVIKQQLQRETAAHGCELNTSTGKWSCGRTSTNCPKRIGETKWLIKETKTTSGYREIEIPNRAWKMLLEHRERVRAARALPTFHPEKGEKLDQLLFTRPDGKPLYAQRDRESLGSLIGSMQNIPEGMTVHTLRHIATTVLVDSGADRDDLIAMMGWSPKNADALIAVYSSADKARQARNTSSKYVQSFYPSAG